MGVRSPRFLALLLVLPALALGACTAAGADSSPTPSAAAASPDSTPAACSNPDGGTCLGVLDAGTYTSSAFVPAMTFTVPDGWQNIEDLDGSFVLLPPGGSAEEYYDSRGDAISVLSDTYAARESCDLGPAAGVDRTPDGIVGYLRQRTSLQISDPKPVTVGGFTGLVVDLTLVPGNALACLAPDHWDPALFAQAGEQGVVVGPGENELMRLYLLDRGGKVTTVGVDAFGGPQDPLLGDLTAIVDSLSFAADGPSSQALAP
jgi:hypothetical protein